MKNRWRNCLILFFILMFVGNTGVTVMQVKEFRQSEETKNRAEELVNLQIPDVQEQIDVESTSILADAMNELDLKVLQKENKDVVGWIMIPDTEISYPLLQGEDNTYYLEHTWEHTKSRGGSIFLEQMCSKDLTDYNTIIYGHRMKNRSMFGSLAFYNDKEYLEAHPYIYLADNQGCHIYEIYAVYETKTDGPVYQIEPFNDEMKKKFIEWTVQESVVDTGIVPELNERILTLSTCTAGNNQEKRWIVQGVLRSMLSVKEK